MACYHPLKAYRSRETNPETGKRGIVFHPRDGFTDMLIELPCGQCIGCRLERSRQWAVRCMHEASLYDQNCFLTLTFSEEHLQNERSLKKADFQKFMKRLRRRTESKVRYYHCGEYGEKLKRPHHHACLFGFDFPDKELWSVRNGVPLYRSELLEQLWPFGFATVGEVTFESAAHVARYIVKKQTGKKGVEEYKDILPPYTTMSRRPGIASDWFKKFKDDVYPDDSVVVRKNIKCRPPRYYDELFHREDEVGFDEVKKSRLQKMNSEKAKKENSPRRLEAKEKVKQSKLKELKRSIHDVE